MPPQTLIYLSHVIHHSTCLLPGFVQQKYPHTGRSILIDCANDKCANFHRKRQFWRTASSSESCTLRNCLLWRKFAHFIYIHLYPAMHLYMALSIIIIDFIGHLFVNMLWSSWLFRSLWVSWLCTVMSHIYHVNVKYNENKTWSARVFSYGR